MIIEIASFPVKADQIKTFQKAFGEVTHLLSRAKGYVGHLLTQGIETPSHFTLIVQWQTLEDHTQVFEPSDDHQVSLRCCMSTLPRNRSSITFARFFPTDE